MSSNVLEREPISQFVAPALAAQAVIDALLPCRVLDPELWFAESPSDVEYAKQQCMSCPARATCLDGALDRGEPWGVWGGELFLQGTVIPRKRPRGRPRKEFNLDLVHAS
jgi:WhiB family transcriptional regulator, redox-sensing transcriptional regulator